MPVAFAQHNTSASHWGPISPTLIYQCLPSMTNQALQHNTPAPLTVYFPPATCWYKLNWVLHSEFLAPSLYAPYFQTKKNVVKECRVLRSSRPLYFKCAYTQFLPSLQLGSDPRLKHGYILPSLAFYLHLRVIPKFLLFLLTSLISLGSYSLYGHCATGFLVHQESVNPSLHQRNYTIPNSGYSQFFLTRSLSWNRPMARFNHCISGPFQIPANFGGRYTLFIPNVKEHSLSRRFRRLTGCLALQIPHPGSWFSFPLTMHQVGGRRPHQ